MKRVTTNITFGQIVFILFIFLAASLIFFYLGAKFGPNVVKFTHVRANIEEKVLPDEKMAQEIKQILKEKDHDFVFYEALQSKSQTKGLIPEQMDKDIVESKTGVPAEVMDEVKKEISQKKDATKVEQTKVEQTKVEPKIEPKVEPKVEAKVVTPKTQPQVKVEGVANQKIEDAPPVATKAVPSLEDKTNLTGLEASNPEAATPPAYCLQLGSYSNKDKANEARAIWAQRGFDVSVVSFDNKEKGEWYRLRVGGYGSLNDALLAQKNLVNKYRESIRIVDLR